MSQYNTKTTGQNVVTNFRGGTAVRQTDEIALISLLATGLTKMFHEAKDDREKRLLDLMDAVAKKDKYLVAQMLVYARTILAQRTVTHRGAVHMASLISGESWGKRFFSKRNRKVNEGGIVYRLDDMLEIAACYFAVNPEKPLSNPMKRGFKMALESADAYELAKYKNDNKSVSLVDLVNLVHPKGGRNAEALKQLVEGTLKQHNTAEDKQSNAVQVVAGKVKSGEITVEEGELELKAAKGENWKELIVNKTIGYLALLRNLRNIIIDAPELITITGELITDREFIRKSLVFPHQIDLALEVILNEIRTPEGRRLLPFLNQAYENSVINLKELNMDEHTAVVIDTSGSMFSSYGNGLVINGKPTRNRFPIEKASLIGATLAKGLGADMYQFSSTCKSIAYNPNDSINTIKWNVLHQEGHVGHSTNFNEIFRTLNNSRGYARIFIISDLQGADNITRGSEYQTYMGKFGRPYLYTVDLTGHGTNMFKANERLFQLVGYSASIYETAKLYETDFNALLTEIRKIII